MAAYVDRCVLLSLLLGDGGYTDSERWLINQGDQTLWISHWVLLEVAGVIATCVRRGQLTAEQAQTIGSEFESFRQERLTLIEPRGTDFCRLGSGWSGAFICPCAPVMPCIWPWPNASSSPW